MRHRIVWKQTALLMVLVGATWALRASLTTPSAVKAYGQIRLGMSPGEVRSVISLPPGYYDGNGPMPLSISSLVKVVRETGLPMTCLPDAAGRLAARNPEALTVER